MRIVTTSISKLGLKIDDVIKVQLLNSIGKPHMTLDGYSLNEDITIDSDTLELSLKENDSIDAISFYKITTPSEFTFTFEVPISIITDNPKHDLISLLNIGCFDGIIDIKNKTKILNINFLEKLEHFFTGENPHFTKNEESLIKLYEYYANEIIGTESTIDIVQMMDEHLATLGVA